MIIKIEEYIESYTGPFGLKLSDFSELIRQIDVALRFTLTTGGGDGIEVRLVGAEGSRPE
jgi:hypothetical protein